MKPLRASGLVLAVLSVACRDQEHSVMGAYYDPGATGRDATLAGPRDTMVDGGRLLDAGAPEPWDAGLYPHHPDPTLVSPGPSLVDARFAACTAVCTVDHYVSGFAYYDPASTPWSILEYGVSQGDGPALKVVLTSWPVEDCDPQAIIDMGKQQSDGKFFALCAAYDSDATDLHGLETEAGGQQSRDGPSSFQQVGGYYACSLDLTSGNRMGGQPLIGTLTVFNDDIPSKQVTSIPFQLKHCGVIDTEGEI